MTPAPLLSRSATAGESEAEPPITERPELPAILGLSAWSGILAGLLEVAAFLLHKRFLDTNPFLNRSRHFLWLVPLTDLLLFLLVGLVGWLVMTMRPAAGRWAFRRVLFALTILPALLVGISQVYGIAWVLLALGVSARFVPVLERHALGFRRFVWRTSPLLVVVLAVLTAMPWAADAIALRHQRGQPIPQGRPNILFVVMDTVAADHLDLYGYGRPTSPTLDELAGLGCRFDAAQPASSWTLVSHATMFTGCWPHDLNVGWHTTLDDAEPTIAGFLSDRGYATSGFVANTSYCGADTGLGRGFTVYRDYILRELGPFRLAVLVQRPLEAFEWAGTVVGDALDLPWLKGAVTRVREHFETERKDAAAVNREFLGWLSSRPEPERPYFAFLNYYDAHSPYQLPPGRIRRFGTRPIEEREYRLIQDWWNLDKQQVSPQDVAYARDAYDDCVASVDEQLGCLFDELNRRGLRDRTWIIVVSDHGESFGEHPGVFLHGSSLYQTELHVPMLIVPPEGVRIRPVVAETTSLRDMAATIADLVGFGQDSPFPGTSMARRWDPSVDADSNPEPALAELVPNETLVPGASEPGGQPWPTAAVIADGWSYLRSGREAKEELYDLRKDPGEHQNLESSAGARLDRMRDALLRLTEGPLTPERFAP